MFKSVFRLRKASVAALVLLLLLPFCVSADEITSQVYIALDNDAELSLAGAFAYYADRTGSLVDMYNISHPEEEAFYTSKNGTSIEAGLQEFKVGKVDKEKLSKHLNSFLATFFKKADFSAASVDVHILSHFDRSKLIYSTWEETTFANTAIHKSYTAICEAMDAHPNLRLHFYYFESSENNRTAMDAKLQEQYPGRVSYIVFPKDISSDELISQVFTSDSSSRAVHAVDGVLPADGGIVYKKTGESELISISFPSEQQPTNVKFICRDITSMQSNKQPILNQDDPHAGMPFVPASVESETDSEPRIEVLSATEGEPSDEAPPADETESSGEAQSDKATVSETVPEENLLLSYSANNTYWLYLPKATQADEITIFCETDVPEAISYTLKTWAELPTPSFMLLDAQKNNPAADGLVIMPGKDITWTLEMEMPGIAFDNISATLTAVVEEAAAETSGKDNPSEADETKEELRRTEIPVMFQTCSIMDGKGFWTFDLHAFPPQTRGELHMNYTVWGQSISEATVLPFFVENQAPVLVSDENPLIQDVYFDIPESSETPNAAHTTSYDLNQYFRDPDDCDTLTFEGPHTDAIDASYEVVDGRLTYTAKGSTSSPKQVTVTATDTSNASVNLTFSFNHHSMRDILDNLRLEPDDVTATLLVGNQFRIAIGEEKTLRFLLSADKTALLSAMLEFLELPEIENCLKVYANGNPCSLSRSENNDLIVTVNLPESDLATQHPLNLQAQFSYIPVAGEESAYPAPISYDLPVLFGNTLYDVAYQNNPPYLKPGINADNQFGTCDIDGMPGKYKEINLLSLADPSIGLDGRFRPDEYFENNEPSETLTYTLLVYSGNIFVTVPDANNEIPLSTGQSYPFTSEEVSQGIEILLRMPDSYHIEILAQDTEKESAERLSYSVKLVSSFKRRLMIGLCTALILLFFVVAVLVIRRKLKPGFGSAHADISYARTMQQNALWKDCSSYTRLALNSYGKDPVSLLTLLVASGHLLPRSCSPEMLAHITFSPRKHGRIMVVCGNKVEVTLFRNNQKVDEPRVILEYNETLFIHFSHGNSGETISLRICCR